MPKTAAVILNYNDAAGTIAAAERIRSFQSIDQIILVDNASTDGSGEKLKNYVKQTADGKTPSRIRLVQNDKNGGYGYGNNRGLDAAKKAGCDLGLIANPDAVFTEKTLEKLETALKEENTAAAGALTEKARYTDCAWPLLSFWGELAYSGPVTKRLFKRKISYPRAFFRMLPAPVGAVHGSLVMVKLPEFFEAGGFDERVFLYMEEKILGKRLAAIGKNIVLTDGVYSHANAGSMKQAGMDAVARQKERQKAERFYYKEYLGAGLPQMLAARLQQAAVLAETKGKSSISWKK